MIRIQTNIYKRKGSNGKVSWMVRWKCPQRGIWVARTAGRTADEARIVEGRIRDLILKGVAPEYGAAKPQEEQTIASLVEHYYQSPRFQAATPLWQKGSRGRIMNQILPKFGHLIMEKLDAKTICDFYFALRDAGHGRSSIHKHHLLMCLLGDVHQERTGSNRNPARSIRGFSKMFPKRATKRAINFLTPDETDRLIAAATTLSQRLLPAFIELLASTGLRREEAMNLKWTDVDRGNGFLHIRQSKNGTSRLVPIEPLTEKALAYFEASRRPHCEHIVVYADGTRPHIDSFLKPFKKAAALAGIEKRVDLHTLRHSYGSNKLRDGWGLKKVSMIMGHSDVIMTANVYSHLLDGDLKVRDSYFQQLATAPNGTK